VAIRISQDQLDEPFQEDPKLLVAAVIKWWGDNFPEALFDFTMDHLTVMAEAAIALAARYDIKGQPQVCAFANLMWLYGPNFDDIPKIRKILTARSDQEAKIEQLYTKVPEALWALADKKRDEGRWIDILAMEATGEASDE